MPENPHVSRTWASFRFWGNELDPDEVTDRLSIVPATAFKKGDPRGKKGIWGHSFWSITSQDRVASTNLELHIAWLLDQLEPVQDQLRALRAEKNRKADIFCFWESATGQGGPAFSPALLKRLASLDLELGLDIYFADENEAVL